MIALFFNVCISRTEMTLRLFWGLTFLVEQCLCMIAQRSGYKPRAEVLNSSPDREAGASNLDCFQHAGIPELVQNHRLVKMIRHLWRKTGNIFRWMSLCSSKSNIVSKIKHKQTSTDWASACVLQQQLTIFILWRQNTLTTQRTSIDVPLQITQCCFHNTVTTTLTKWIAFHIATLPLSMVLGDGDIMFLTAVLIDFAFWLIFCVFAASCDFDVFCCVSLSWSLLCECGWQKTFRKSSNTSHVNTMPTRWQNSRCT